MEVLVGGEMKSKCCGAETEIITLEIEYDHNDMPIHDIEEVCSQCHKPCKVEETKDE